VRKSIITLLTDFGTKEHYVASIKGVILNINPHCTLVDITHQVKPQDVKEGAFILANAYTFFPKGTIHLSVVDPGVGGTRRAILVVTQDYFFVGPDNGLFTLAAPRERVKQVVALTNKKFFLPKVCNTFHGRDLFAPVAAHLSLGVRPEAFGNELDSWVELDFRKPIAKGKELTGEVLHIDAFGNLISNMSEDDFFCFVKDHRFVIKVGKRTIHGLKRGYWAGKRNEPIALLGGGRFLEISVREGNAQKILKVKRGDLIRVQRSS
jgi:S-adenosylmethionine hydrolase